MYNTYTYIYTCSFSKLISTNNIPIIYINYIHIIKLSGSLSMYQNTTHHSNMHIITSHIYNHCYCYHHHHSILIYIRSYGIYTCIHLINLYVYM